MQYVIYANVHWSVCLQRLPSECKTAQIGPLTHLQSYNGCNFFNETLIEQQIKTTTTILTKKQRARS